jgi:putative SOS response-associated peptidase YedK
VCNRYYNELTVDQIALMLGDLIEVLPEARHRAHKVDQRLTDELLILFPLDGRLVLGTGRWGFPKQEKHGPGWHMNARSEALDTTWKACARCWLPSTGWIEYEGDENDERAKRTSYLVTTPDRSPFLLAGVCAVRDGARRVAMTTQDSPSRLSHLCDRMPIPYSIEAIAEREPEQMIDRMVVTPC